MTYEITAHTKVRLLNVLAWHWRPEGRLLLRSVPLTSAKIPWLSVGGHAAPLNP